MSETRVIVLRRRAARAPQKIATWDLEPELAAYIERHLRAHWPQTRVWHAPAAPPFDPECADLWICGREPEHEPRAPTLWLGAVERRVALSRIGERLWTCSMPFAGRDLLRLTDQVWRQSR